MKLMRILPLAALAVIASCKQAPSGQAPAAATTPAAVPIAVVNGKSLSTDLLDMYVKALSGRELNTLSPEQRSEAVNSLISLEIVQQEAEKQSLTKDKATAAMLDLSRYEVLQRALSTNYLKGKQPTDAELRAEYDSQIAGAPRTEYRVRHILVQSEELARNLLGRLAKGGRFEQLAASFSADQQSKARGGDLGWATATAFAPPFAQAMLAMKKGQTSANPVQTQFGWHVIRVDDTREAQLPAFDSVKDRLTQIVQLKKFKAYTDELLKTAKIEVKG